MADDTSHFDTEVYEKLHKPKKNTTEGGACLNGRCLSYYDTDSCSYRYQGREAARSYLHIYNTDRIDEKCHLDDEKGAVRTRVVGALSKAGVRREIPISGKMRVEITTAEGTDTKIVDVIKDIGANETFTTDIPTTTDKDSKQERPYTRYADDKGLYKKRYWFLNFTVGSVPWPNQVHHVLNQSSLNKVIASFENIPDVVIKGLLNPDSGEPYNVNHKDNMVILPTREKETRATGLPTHGSHPTYSKENILPAVRNALSGYKSLNADAENQDHPAPDPLAVRKRLIAISEKWYKRIIDVVDENKKRGQEDEVVTVNDLE